MFNPRLTETLTDFPFARLNARPTPIAPRAARVSNEKTTREGLGRFAEAL